MKSSIWTKKSPTIRRPHLSDDEHGHLRPSANSLLYALALAKHKIPYELHVYPQGEHGASSCNFEVNVPAEFLKRNAKWLDDCASFFRLFTEEKY
ncbi:MAG: hypothetical protein ACLRSW_13400 [Christensenellaceae bacterium]